MKSLLDYKNDNIWLMHGDCLERMKEIPSGSVDMILTDPPYGTTACKWDSIIPLELMWSELERIIKPNGAIVMTASQPFTTKLISSNYKMFKYCWTWEKSKCVNFAQARNMPLKFTEDVCIFSNGTISHITQDKKGTRMTYNPQGLKRTNKLWKRPKQYGSSHTFDRPSHQLERVIEFEGYPTNIIKISNSTEKKMHPTQKPVPLMEYLIKTYTNENETETVLDFTYGSGTTGVACMNLNRNFIGIEMDDKYFNIGKERILMAQEQQRGITISPSQVA